MIRVDYNDSNSIFTKPEFVAWNTILETLLQGIYL